MGPVNLFALLNGGAQVAIGSNLDFGSVGTYLTGPNNPVPIGVDASGDNQPDSMSASISRCRAASIFLTLDGAVLKSVVQQASGSTDVLLQPRQRGRSK